MKIEVITPALNEAGFGVKECNSMYEAHTNKICYDAKGWPSEIYVDGILQDHLPSDVIQPDTYTVKTN
jgi:hypothetical protein